MITTDKTILLSKKGMKELKKSIARLERDQQRVIKELRDLDRTDGHDQRLARVEKLAELEIIEGKLADKQQLHLVAQPFPRKRDALKVALGSAVELIDKSGRKFCYTIVDSIEANPSDGRISANSPLGQTLLGRTIEETIKWGHGMAANQFKLVRIS